MILISNLGLASILSGGVIFFVFAYWVALRDIANKNTKFHLIGMFFGLLVFIIGVYLGAVGGWGRA